MSIDIKPDDESNRLNPGAKRGVWVVVLSDGDFDLAQIDVSTLRFGPADATVRHEIWDLNGDSASDLALRFDLSDTGIRYGDSQATLGGPTWDGLIFGGTDSITTVGCRKKSSRRSSPISRRITPGR